MQGGGRNPGPTEGVRSLGSVSEFQGVCVLRAGPPLPEDTGLQVARELSPCAGLV